MGKRSRELPDLRWLIASIILAALLIITIAVNNNQQTTDTNLLSDALDIDNGDLKINWDSYPTFDIELSESLTISQSGTYHLTGDLDNGSILIKSAKGQIRLILDNVVMTSESGPVIKCDEADDLVIELEGENTLADSSDYSKITDADVTGAIYSKGDLTFQGNGTLNLTANYQDAIVGKDDVKFKSGKYHIVAEDDAIRGKDSIYIVGGNFDISANNDCFKATNDVDTGKGFVLVEDGSFNLISKNAKAIKTTKILLLKGGNYSISTFDDAIHSDNYIAITGSIYNITSGDDGIHANNELIIDGGELHIIKAYEGLEAQIVTINNGDIDLITTDDGINAGGGADKSSQNRPGANPFKADEKCTITINGGKVYVNASGDGIDSNGWLYINGGNVIVDGPTNNGNGALDAGMGVVMNGGEVYAIGSSGMATTLGNTSSIFNVSVYFNTVEPASTKITIKNKSEETILEHTSAKQFSHLAFGSPKLQLGDTYTLYINDEEYTSFTLSDITTEIGKTNNMPKR